jgi:hypothetical protein
MAQSMFPGLCPSAAKKIRGLGDGERDQFVPSSSAAAYASSLRHAKGYEFATRYTKEYDIQDIGCGSGSGAVYLFGQVTAIDVERDLWHCCRQFGPTRGSNGSISLK